MQRDATNPKPETEVEHMSTRLTQPQRSVVVALTEEWSLAPLLAGHRRKVRVCTDLHRMGLADRRLPGLYDGHCYHYPVYRLTPLGLAVRAALAEGGPNAA